MEPEVGHTRASPLHDSSFTPVGSPEADACIPPSEEDLDHDPDPDPDPDHDHDHDHDHDQGQLLGYNVTSQDLKHKIIKQAEYYFSDENLPKDKYMMDWIRKNKEGFVPITVISSFRKMKKLTRDHSFIVSALRDSSFLVVSADGKKVKRLLPFPVAEVKDPKFFTVLVENLPEDNSVENIRKIFGEAGVIKNISIRNPHAVEDSKKGSKSDILISSSKLHALVEYETTEAAERAVSTLNDERDWRNGMRVKLLRQWIKYGQRKKAGKELDFEKNHFGRAPNHIGDEENHNINEHHDDTPDEGDAENVSKEKNGQPGRNRGRTRKKKYHVTHGLGHGTTSSVHAIECTKPPPGPKMPDGTRGFTMGRGRPPVPK